MDIVRSTPPENEALTVDEARAHLVMGDDTSQDTLITSLIAGVREYVEEICNRSVMTQTWLLYLRDWPKSGIVHLPRPPLVSVTSVKYYDSEGDLQTMDAADYIVNTASLPGRISLATDAVWPIVQDRDMAIVVEYVAGFASAELVPTRVKAAMLLMVGDLFENREGSIVGTITSENLNVQKLLRTFKSPEVY